MRDYDSTVKNLREAAKGLLFDAMPYRASVMQDAANAIEELNKALDAVNDAHNEGYDVGYWAARRDFEPRWISVEERLPEIGRTVLTSDGVDVWTNWRLRVGNKGVVEIQWAYNVEEVTHWMPLPSVEGLNGT